MNLTPVRTPAWRRIMSFCLVLVLLAALVPASALRVNALNAGDVLYLKPNSNWTQSNAWFAAYFFNNSNNTNEWVKMTDIDGDGYYECKVPKSYPNVIFVRMNSGKTALNWDSKWNQTGNLTLGTSNRFTVPDGAWDGSTSGWTKITPSYYLMGIDGDWATGKTMTVSGSKVTLSVQLGAGTYTLKLKRLISGAETWYGKTNASFTDTTNGIVLTSNSSAGNVSLVASGGTYTFTYDIVSASLSVTHEAAAHQHEFTILQSETPATCEGDGSKVWKCTGCDQTNTETITAIGHDWDNGTITTQATCTADGVKTYTCTNDKTHTKTETVPATGHNYVNGSCSNCGAAQTAIYLKADHWTADNAGFAAQFDGNGTWVAMTGPDANGYYKVYVPAGSTKVKFARTKPDNAATVWNESAVTTIPTDGKNAYTINAGAWSGANGSWSTYIACDHPNHNQDGTCTSCGAKVEHSYMMGECIICGQTCNHPGHDNYGQCVNCDAMLGHNYVKSTTVEATCTEDGYTEYSCSCGSVRVDDFVHALGHTYNDGEVTAPTCTEEGYTKYTCTVCGFETYGDRKEATGHSDPLLEIESVDSTCNVRGYKKLKCANCDYTIVEYKEMGEHNYVNGTCSVCGHVNTTSTRRIYFDATLSKLSYNGDAGTNTIPVANGNSEGTKVAVHYWKEGQSGTNKDMTRITGTDIWYVDIPQTTTHVIFWSGSSIPTSGSARTGDLKLSDEPNSCFYADSSDMCIYKGAFRDGYWGKPFQIRDPKHAANRTAVDIPTGAFAPAANTMYVGTTFYDYYTDYELNGYNRKDYTDWGGDSFASQRNWVPFRHFNQALSTYYSTNGVKVPIYVGHFQPHWGYDNSLAFRNIAGTLNLYGFEDGKAYGSTSTDQRYFMSVNNSRLEVGSDSIDHKLNSAAQGIVDNKLNNGTLTTSGKAMPYFDANFINGTNSKRTKLGEVYENVQFPFTQKTIDGVQYWSFDSNDTTLQMTKDSSGTVGYYLNTASGDKYKNLNSGSGQQSTKGFFPFNYNSSAGNANTYNYGYGARIDVDFTLSDDGMVVDVNGNKKPMVFTFSGDDDVWVFIDGQLVLDIGGSHGKVTGEINFAEEKSTVSSVKSSGGTQNPSATQTFTVDKSKTHHTLTMFYMERGMWESNMSIRFNFIPQNVIMPEVTAVTATKTWNLDTKTASAVKVRLQRRVGTGTWENVGDPVTLTPSGNTATHEFKNVKLYADDAQTVAYTFRVVELDAAGKPLNDGDTYNGLVVAYGKMEGNVSVGYTQTISNNEVVVQKVVIDFGLPVDATVFVPALAESIRNTGKICGIADPSKLPIGKIRDTSADPDLVTTFVAGKYGNFSISGDKIRYTPTKMTMEVPETIGYAIEYMHNGTAHYYYSTVTVIPAANIYYEDYFLRFTDSTSSAKTDTVGTWSAATNAGNNVQAEDRPGVDELMDDYDANNIYGFDPAYANCAQYSLGAARWVTVNAETGKASNAPKATFTFTGTGFDVIGLTNTTSGGIWVQVNDKDGKTVKSYLVNTYYGYKTQTNNKGETEWVIDTTSNDCLYQVPVIKVEKLPYGTYDVTIRAAYLTSMDMRENQSYTVWLDAIRIYNPAQSDSTSQGAYAQDSEANPVLITIKDELIEKTAFETSGRGNGIIFVDGKSTGVTIEDYKNQGPNNETYLKPGNGIVFKLVATTTEKPTAVHMGAKLAKGSSADLWQGNSKLYTITTATNMFYNLGVNWTGSAGNWQATVILSCQSTDRNAILSLTDIMLTSNEVVVVATGLDDEAQTNSNQRMVYLLVDEETAETGIKVMSNLYSVDDDTTEGGNNTNTEGGDSTQGGDTTEGGDNTTGDNTEGGNTSGDKTEGETTEPTTKPEEETTEATTRPSGNNNPSSGNNRPTQDSSNAATGDNLMLFVMLMLFSLMSMAAMILVRKKEEI